MPFTAGGWTFRTFVLTANSANTELRFGGYDGPDAFYLDDLYLAEPTVGLCLIPGDADRSGAVNFADITKVLENWGFICAP